MLWQYRLSNVSRMRMTVSLEPVCLFKFMALLWNQLRTALESSFHVTLCCAVPPCAQFESQHIKHAATLICSVTRCFACSLSLISFRQSLLLDIYCGWSTRQEVNFLFGSQKYPAIIMQYVPNLVTGVVSLGVQQVAPLMFYSHACGLA